MKLLNFTIIKLTFCLLIGISAAHYTTIPTPISMAIALVFLGATWIVYRSTRNRLKNSIWFGVLALVTMVCVGILTYNLHDQKQFKTHYSHFINVDNNAAQPVIFKIRDVLKPNTYYDKYVVDILEINQNRVVGKALLNIEKDTLVPAFMTDAILAASLEFKTLGPPLNPYQFNYQSYLEKQYIYHQIFTHRSALYKLDRHAHTLWGLAAKLRQNINHKLQHYHFSKEQLAIINALLLGQRQDIAQDIYTNYVRAGAIHILAISGLHVGIVLLILNFVLKPLTLIKNGNYLKMSVIVVLLWAFAIIAGLSASVTRAVTMFSIIAIAMHLKRPTNIYNTLAISVFILLLFKPMFLFDVGFQLSYLAVIAIVSIQPLLYNLWRPRYWLVDFLWKILTVTTAAQFGVGPISLYYFHQFPGLFFISNLSILPFLGIILALGLIVIILALLNGLPNFLADTLGFMINCMNQLVSWVAKQEAFLFTDIAFNLAMVVAVYLVFIALYRTLSNPQFANYRLSLLSIFLLQGVFIATKQRNHYSAFVIFQKSRQSLLATKKGSNLVVSSYLDTLAWRQNYTLNNFAVGSFSTTIKSSKLKSVYHFNHQLLLVVDSLGVYKPLRFKPDYVLLRTSPKINLDRLIDSICPRKIIADGSNYKSYIQRWQNTCKKRKLPFHNTSKEGAFMVIY